MSGVLSYQARTGRNPTLALGAYSLSQIFLQILHVYSRALCAESSVGIIGQVWEDPVRVHGCIVDKATFHCYLICRTSGTH